jgi:hypothetical protein
MWDFVTLKRFYGNTYSHPFFINKSLKVRKHVAFHEGPITKYFANKRKENTKVGLS